MHQKILYDDVLQPTVGQCDRSVVPVYQRKMSHKRRLVELTMSISESKGFGKYLSSHHTKLLEGGRNSVSYSYSTPEVLCRPLASKTTPSMLSTSAILALFDEFSTYGLMSHCKTSRPGVSVHLSTEIVEPVPAGQEVVIRSQSDKIGKALGFCSMQLYTTDGKLLARGKHIKYLPMGSAWDFLMGPMMLPFTLAMYNFFTTNAVGKFLSGLFSKKNKKSSSDASTTSKEISGLGSMFTELGLTAAEAKGGADKKDFEFKSSSKLLNLLGALHGGALAAAIEEACMMSRRGSATSGDQYVIQSMKVRYLSPLKVRRHGFCPVFIGLFLCLCAVG